MYNQSAPTVDPVSRGKRPRAGQDVDFNKHIPSRKVTGQRPVDYFCSAIHHIKTRNYRRDPSLIHVPPHPYYCHRLLPVSHTTFEPATALCTQWVHTIFHPDAKTGMRRKTNYSSMQWAPNGRRILCATNQGEFLLYNGHSFTIELKTPAHEKGCKSLAWGPTTDLILSGDESGVIKVWMSNFQEAAEFDTNQNVIHEIGWSPGEAKFVSGGGGSAKIWDTNRATSGGGDVVPETRLEGHGGDVSTVDWHPTRALVLTGSKDCDARLWDPRKAESNHHIATLQSHAKPITCARWHTNGHWFLTAAKDNCVKLWDTRTMKEVTSYEGHTKDVTSIAWHPSVSNLFGSSSLDGSINLWIVSPGDGVKKQDGVLQVEKPNISIVKAHEDNEKGNPNGINSLQWSPIGHLLCSAAQEVKMWARNKPGATLEERQGQDIIGADSVFS